MSPIITLIIARYAAEAIKYYGSKFIETVKE